MDNLTQLEQIHKYLHFETASYPHIQIPET